MDGWTTNERLQHYHLRQGFTYARTVVLPTTRDRPSGYQHRACKRFGA